MQWLYLLNLKGNSMQEKTKDQWVSQGIAYLHQRLPEKALVACLYARQIDPLYSRAHHGLGIIFDQLGLYIDAQSSYEKAIQLDPDNPKLNSDMAVFFYNRGEYKKSGEFYRKARKLDPKYDRDYRKKIKTCSNEEIALELAADDPELICDIAHTLYERGKYKLSGEIYRKIIRLDSKYGSFYANKLEKLLEKGIYFKYLQKYDSAIHIYKHALLFAPDDQSALSSIRECEDKKNNPNLSVPTYSSSSIPTLTVHPFNCTCHECYEI